MPSTSDKRRTGLFAVGFFLGACGLILGLTNWDRRLSTDILDLLPPDETSLEARLLAGFLEAEQTDQVTFAVGEGSEEAREAALADLRRRLDQSGLLATSIMSESEAVDEAASFLFANRLELLFPTWLAGQKSRWQLSPEEVEFPEWLATQNAGELDRFLNSPEGFFYADGIPEDPLLMLPQLWAALPNWNATSPNWTTLTARLKGSAFEDAFQDRTVPNLERIRDTVEREHPEISVLMTGAVFFARSSRIAIREEVERLNLFSLLAVMGVILISLRRPLGLLAVAPMVICGLAGGLVATLIVFGRLHVIMLVLGAFLAGVTVDYGFHVYVNPGRRGDRSIWKPLGVAAGSTAVGFLALLFGTLPVVRQLGLFVGTGVLCALFAAWCLRPAFPPNLTEPRAWLLRQPSLKLGPTTIRIGLLLLLAAAAGGLWQVKWRDDIRELARSDPGLLAEDARVREAGGGVKDGEILITSGTTYLDAIDNWRNLEQSWPTSETPGLVSLARFLPSTDDLEGTRDFLGDGSARWLEALKTQLVERDYDTDAFKPFFHSFDALKPALYSGNAAEAGLIALADSLSGPLAFLMPRGEGIRGVSSVCSGESFDSQIFLGEYPDTISASQMEGLNDAFERYRLEGWRLVLIGFLVVAAGVVVMNGIGSGLRILFIPVSAVLIVFGVLGWMQRDLNLFHLLAGLLGFCIALDHALFTSHFRARGLPPPVSVRISALTTVVAFGVLSLSAIPAVAALGSTVASIVAATSILIEISAAVDAPPGTAPDRQSD